MKKTLIQLLFATVLVSGCSSYSVGPIDAGKNSYLISKQLTRFSGDKELLLASVFEQANKVCADKKSTMQVEQLNEYSSIWRGESKATLVFSCIQNKAKQTKVVKASKPAKTTKPVTKNNFPKKSRLMNFAM